MQNVSTFPDHIAVTLRKVVSAHQKVGVNRGFLFCDHKGRGLGVAISYNEALKYLLQVNHAQDGHILELRPSRIAGAGEIVQDYIQNFVDEEYAEAFSEVA